jgi:hypothetical protein
VPCGPGAAELPRDFAALSRKDGVLLALGELSGVLRKKVGDEAFAAQIEPIVRTHVAPEMGSAVGFMRARACAIYSKLYRSLTFSDADHFARSTAALVGCLRDPELPVRVQAAMALQHLITKDQAGPLLRPRIPEVSERGASGRRRVCARVQSDCTPLVLSPVCSAHARASRVRSTHARLGTARRGQSGSRPVRRLRCPGPLARVCARRDRSAD